MPPGNKTLEGPGRLPRAGEAVARRETTKGSCPIIPIRTCIACRARAPQTELVRLVRVENLVVDATSPRLPGRGAYLHADCLELADKRQAIRRVFGPGASLGFVQVEEKG